MNGLTEWRIRHHVSLVALAELRVLLAAPVTAVLQTPNVALSEAAVQNNVRLLASKNNILTFRNNSGAGKLENGNFVRWGLCNDTPALNKTLKSCDLIGVRSVTVTQDMVGKIAGIFWARECKPSTWKKPSGERELAQQRFIELLTLHGADASFTNGSQ